ncbi:hypothetical protein Pyn_05156 [Prunus yedoensis var. nudiflora]|uniref:Uncharacterized protein n=1 Tax=Prunus yedoensis var. nudiflora TaxID=2094558 RepID=A0A314YU92_PRUYE|nr:hypothetical protein Pyn_05156 [Prunus yedoensis var. nudiflora]
MAREEEEEDKGRVPMLIAMKGHPGTGKTTLANSLASTLKLPLLDKDDVRDKLHSLQASSSSRVFRTKRRVIPRHLADGGHPTTPGPQRHRGLAPLPPKDEAEWRRRLERRAEAGGGPGWHKPSTWRDMEKLLDGYGGCTEYDVGDVPKMGGYHGSS